jgi:hypothetical protein
LLFELHIPIRTEIYPQLSGNTLAACENHSLVFPGERHIF